MIAISYLSRFQTLEKAYQSIDRMNELYRTTKENIERYSIKLERVQLLQYFLKRSKNIIAHGEKEWRDAITQLLEAEINKNLTLIFPTDNYHISLDYDVVRNKIHLKPRISSKDFDKIKINKSQGRLLTQIASVSAVIAILKLQGINTIYIDEAFSGSSKENLEKVGSMIAEILEDGINLIMIVQNSSIATNLTNAHIYHFSRSALNETTIKEDELCYENRND